MKEFSEAGRLAGRLAANGLRYRLLRTLGRAGRPQAVSLEVTRRCVCRCVMCNIWKVPHAEPELSLREWVELLADSLPYEGFTYLGELLRRGPRRFLQMHRHLGLDKYV